MEHLSKNIEVAKLFNEVIALVKGKMSKKFEKIGTTMPQGMIIGIISHHGSMKVSELSAKMGLSNSTVSVMLDKLEKQKIVERTRSTEDKRAVYVSLLESFKKTNKNFHGNVEANIKDIISKGSEEEIDKIIEGLITFKKILNS
jgi:MarR family transcriptional regulator, organic hydroperoxide resistance regulator